MSAVTKRSSMTLFSDARDHYSHRVRMVLAEKGVTVDIVDVDPGKKPEDLAEINPYNSLPTLLDRDLVLYEANVIMEYLDERFPHPPLLPVYPVQRALSRLWITRVEKEWSQKLDILMAGKGREIDHEGAPAAFEPTEGEDVQRLAPVAVDDVGLFDKLTKRSGAKHT